MSFDVAIYTTQKKLGPGGRGCDYDCCGDHLPNNYFKDQKPLKLNLWLNQT